MTRDELDALLAGIGAGPVTLPFGGLPPRVVAYLGAFLPTGQLTLVGASRTDAVTVAGTGAGGPFDGMAVTVRFTVVADTVTAVRLTATGGPTWSFAGTFPVLRGGLFDELRFDAPTLVLDSTGLTGTEPADLPMTFQGALRVAPGMTVLHLLFPASTHPMTGEITMVDLAPAGLELPTPTVPLLVLFGAADHALHLGPVTLTDLRYELIGEPRLNYHTVDHEVAAYALVTGALPVTVGTETRPVLISARVGGWTDPLRLTADFGKLGPLTLADIARIAGQPDIAVPFGIDPGAGITLGPVTVHVDPGAPDPVRRITMAVYTEAEWTIVENLLTLEQIDLNLAVHRPFSDPTTHLRVSGLFGIGENGALELAIDSESRSLGGALREGDPPLSIREVWTHFTGTDPDHLPDLRVVRFHALAQLPDDDTGGTTFDGEAVLAGDWAITDGIDLLDVAFDVHHTPQATSFRALAGFEIHGINLGVRAAYDPAPDRQWEFAGQTGPGQAIPIGALVESLAQRYGGLTLPAPLSGLTVDDLGIEVSTGARRLYVTGQACFSVDHTDVAITVTVDTARHSFDGVLELAVPVDGGTFHPRLDVHLAADPTARRLAASYAHGDTDPVPTVRDLVATVSPTAAGYVPAGITVDPRHLLFALTEPVSGTGTAYLFGVDLALTVDLARLPVVGEHLTGDTSIGVDLLRVLAATAALAGPDVDALNALLPTAVPRLPAAGLPAGFTVDGTLRLGPLTAPVTLPVTGVTGTTPAPAGPVPLPANQATTGDNAAWLTVQRSFGPVRIARVGVAFRAEGGQDPRVAVLLDASVSVGGLDLSLQGLEVGVKLSDPLAVPSFDLHGMGLSYANGPVTITGAFLKSEIKYQGHTYPAYGGAAQLRNGDLSLAAIGSYTQLPEGPSVFVYAWLDYPLGGPPFFHVRGLAAGFGYNRRLVLPPITEVASFPLVAEAIGPRNPGSTLADELRVLADWLPPSVGDVLLAAGVHFTSFQMVDSFVLVAATFGHRFELDVLGLSTLTIPAPDLGAAQVTPIAQVQLALRASFVPEDGYLTVLAQLTRESYLLSRACHLTGGIAFSTWFAGDHDGDFVLTAGGYHPHFPVPAHYPVVPRLGFQWRVSPELSLSGSAYYALTPGALMAGGALSALWQDGSLRAWFDASMDFLISWQPYHYEAALHVSVGASYTYHFFGTHTINVHVGTDVELWGPDFGGTAKIDLSITSIRISFGADRPGGPAAVSWARFRDSLLPARAEITSITLRADSHRTSDAAGSDDLGTVDADSLVLRTDSVIPATGAVRGPDGRQVALPTTGATTRFGVGPVGVAVGGVTATHRITITRAGVDVEDRFVYTPTVKNLPSALWGGRIRPSTTDPAMVPGLLTGYTIRPRPAPVDGDPAWLKRDDLRADTPIHTVPVIGLVEPTTGADDTGTAAERAKLITGSLRTPAVAAARAAVATALLPDVTIDLAGFDTSEFHEIPRVAQHV